MPAEDAAKRKRIVLTLLAIDDGAKKLLEDLFQTS
jgi:hypothetical protein